jgi:hypothetical protein
MSKYLEFMERKRKEHLRAVQRHANLNTPTSWRMRLRVRIISKLNTDALEYKSSFRGRRVLIRSRNKGEPLNQAEWIVFLARRFRTAEQAAEFGIGLQAAISTMAAIRSFPVDVGYDNAATSVFGEVVKQAMAKEGWWLTDDVHGVDVIPDTQTAMIAAFGASVTTTTNPEYFVAPIEGFGYKLAKVDDRTREASSLVNAAFMAPHPVAMLTLGVAAIEMLSTSERWNVAQREWIKGLLPMLAQCADLSDGEKSELRHAVEGLHHFGALSRTRRLLRDLSLVEILPRWEDLYKKRSRLLHGSKIIPAQELQALGGEARTLSQTILKAHIEKTVGRVDW